MDRFHTNVIVLMAVFLTRQCWDVALGWRKGRCLVVEVAAVLVRMAVLGMPVSFVRTVGPLNKMRLGPMSVRNAVRHGEAGRREAGNTCQKEEGPSGPA
jgi:hypothetical protein